MTDFEQDYSEANRILREWIAAKTCTTGAHITIAPANAGAIDIKEAA